MKSQLKIDGIGTLTVSSEYIGDKASSWNKNNFNNHLIEISFIDDFVAHGSYTVSNAGGYLVQISDSGDSARLRDSFGSDNPKTSDWFEIQYIPNEEGELDDDANVELIPIIDPEGYNVPLDLVMRIESVQKEGSCDFEYWSSIMNPEIQNENDLFNAFHSFVSDGLSGLLSFEDFCLELGYDSDSISHKKIHDSCVESYQKLIDVFGSEETIEIVYSYMTEEFDI